MRKTLSTKGYAYLRIEIYKQRRILAACLFPLLLMVYEAQGPRRSEDVNPVDRVAGSEVLELRSYNQQLQTDLQEGRGRLVAHLGQEFANNS